jgi:hypothetical protein
LDETGRSIVRWQPWLAPASLPWTRSVAAGVTGIVVAWLLVVLLSDPSLGFLATAQDARSYFGLDLAAPYVGRAAWGTVGAFPYSPAFAQLVWPLGLLSWPLFVAAWTAILLGCLAWLTGRQLLLAGLLIAALEVAGGNISLLLAVAIVLGFRWPATWSFVLLTKITPGVGLLWFAVRREWRSLVIALGATVAIAGASFVLLPDAWAAWVGVLRDNVGGSGTWAAVPLPLGVRLPIAVLLVTWGARQGRRWTVPVSAMLALPALWYGSLAMLLAIIPLLTEQERTHALAALRVLRARRRVSRAVGRAG